MSAALRDHLPQAWLNKLDEAHNEDAARIAFSYDREICQLLQNTEWARSESQRLYSELKKDDTKTDIRKNVKGQPVFNADTAPPNNGQSEGQRVNGQKRGKGPPLSAFLQFVPDIGPQQRDKQPPPYDNGGAHGRGNGQNLHGSWNPVRGFRQQHFPRNDVPSRGGYQQTGPGYFDNTCHHCGQEWHFARDCVRLDTRS